MNIRKADFEDIKDISAIYAASWKKAYIGMIPQSYLDDLKYDFWVAAFEEWFKNKAVTSKIIFDDDKPVGSASYRVSSDSSLPDWGEIQSFYMLPEYFGKGFSKELMKSVLDDMKKEGFKNIFLWVLNENTRAQKFYKKLGFSSTSDTLECEVGGKKLIDIRFVISI